jgi:hypothetical protein
LASENRVTFSGNDLAVENRTIFCGSDFQRQLFLVVIFVEITENSKTAENYLALVSAACAKQQKILEVYFRWFFLVAKNYCVLGNPYILISILHQF